MTPEQINQANAELRKKSALDIVKWAISHSGGRAIVSTNFRPYEAVILHLVTQVQPDIPVLWVDHGYNRPATYRHAEQLRERLKLNVKAYLPNLTAAHYDAVHGGMPEPAPENEERIKAFSTVMKLEPFQRGMKELAPSVWITALRKVQNPNRAGLDIVSHDGNFGSRKVSPDSSRISRRIWIVRPQMNISIFLARYCRDKRSRVLAGNRLLTRKRARWG